ncbi:apolipoprotein C-III [Phaethornis superciliosus]
MKLSLLFALICTAVLAVGARAEGPEEPEALRSVQEYTQKATAMAKETFTALRDSEAIQQARRWLSETSALAKEKLARLKEQIADLWKKTQAP